MADTKQPKPIVTRLPTGDTNIWSQQNISDIIRTDRNSGIVGNLYSSFNIDLVEKDGKLRGGKRMVVNTNSNDVAQLVGSPVGFKVGNSGSVYTAAGVSGTGYVFNNTPSGGNNLTPPFVKNTVSGGATAPSTLDSKYTDIEIMSSQIYVTTNQTENVYFLNQGETSWTEFKMFGDSTSDSSAYPHMLMEYKGRMYCTWGGHNILSWDDSGSSFTPANFSNKTGAGSLTIGDSATTSQVIWMRPASDRIWIGTLNTVGGKGYIYSWDGESNNYMNRYRLPSAGALACVVKDDVPWVIDTYGRLLKWNGGTFVQVAQFNMLNKLFLYNAMGTANDRFIHPNGMAILNNQVSALIDGRNYDGSNTAPQTFSQLETIPSGVWQYDELYGWFHKHSLATTHVGDTISDYGQTYLSGNANIGAVGGLSELISSMFLNGSGQDGSFLAGGTYTVDVSSSGVVSAVFYDNNADTLKKVFTLTTQKIPSENITDIWQKIFVAHHPLINSADRMVVKYRTSDLNMTNIVVTGATSSTITTTDSNAGNYTIGDEVEFISGINAGICAHITATSLVSSTYTITLDETITTTSAATSRTRFQKWIKLNETTDQTAFFNEIGIGKTSTWIQFKIWVLCTGTNELESITIVSHASQQTQ